MASVKIDDLPRLTELNESDLKNLLIIETDSGTRAISYKTLTKILNDKINETVGIPTPPQKLLAGQPEVSFTVDNLQENSGIRVEVADISTLSHRGITIEGNIVTVKFEPQAEDVWVRLVIYNMDGIG